MAKTQLTTELLIQFAELLTHKREIFEQIKKSMDNMLHDFVWDDPVAHKFKNNYEEQMQPLKEKLLPAMINYEKHLKDLSGLGDVYNENGSPKSIDLKAAVTPATVEGGATAAVGISTINSYRSKDYSGAFKGVDFSAKKWGSKTKQQKIAELQKLENNIAEIQNRTAATIKEKQYTNNNLGDYDGANNIIYINKELLEGDYDYNKLKQVVNTTAHEGRHGCQYDASMTSNSTAICGTTDEKKEWKKEFSDMTNEYAEEGKILKKCNIVYTNKGQMDLEATKRRVFSDEMHRLGSVCDWNNYRYGNKIETDAWSFGDWFEKQFEQKFPKKPGRRKIT